jgi:hypothetical protein
MQFAAEINPDQFALLPMLMIWNGEHEDGRDAGVVLSVGFLCFHASVAFFKS